MKLNILTEGFQYIPECFEQPLVFLYFQLSSPFFDEPRQEDETDLNETEDPKDDGNTSDGGQGHLPLLFKIANEKLTHNEIESVGPGLKEEEEENECLTKDPLEIKSDPILDQYSSPSERPDDDTDNTSNPQESKSANCNRVPLGLNQTYGKKKACPQCNKHFPTQRKLSMHLCSHWRTNIISLYHAETKANGSDEPTDDKHICRLCDTTLESGKALFIHVGLKHKFLHRVMTSKQSPAAVSKTKTKKRGITLNDPNHSKREVKV